MYSDEADVLSSFLETSAWFCPPPGFSLVYGSLSVVLFPDSRTCGSVPSMIQVWESNLSPVPPRSVSLCPSSVILLAELLHNPATVFRSLQVFTTSSPQLCGMLLDPDWTTQVGQETAETWTTPTHTCTLHPKTHLDRHGIRSGNAAESVPAAFCLFHWFCSVKCEMCSSWFVVWINFLSSDAEMKAWIVAVAWFVRFSSQIVVWCFDAGVCSEVREVKFKIRQTDKIKTWTAAVWTTDPGSAGNRKRLGC